jgi:hypothetical protein
MQINYHLLRVLSVGESLWRMVERSGWYSQTQINAEEEVLERKRRRRRAGKPAQVRRKSE